MEISKQNILIINSTCDLFSLILLLLFVISIARNKNRRGELNLFITDSILLFYGICTKICTQIFLYRQAEGGDSFLVLAHGGDLTNKCILAAICPLLAFYVQRSDENLRSKLWTIALSVLAVPVCAAALYAPIRHWYPFFLLLQILLSFCFFLTKARRSNGGIWFALSLLFPAAACFIHAKWSDLELYGAGFSLMLQATYLYHQVDMEKEILEKELALSQSQMQLLTNQISPHFIFNSLQVIQNLCDEEQEKVKPALIHFSEYLRSNLESLTTVGRIPFLRELAHTKEYLLLEQLGDSKAFDVEYRLGVTDFTLPPLTIQPIMENAVRYGIGTKEKGGVVILETAKDAFGTISIRVIDDGHGKDSTTKRQKERQSIGLANVRTRLRLLCDGQITIEKSGTGTTVTLFVPRGG